MVKNKYKTSYGIALCRFNKEKNNQSEILMFLKRDKLQRIIDNNLSNAIKYSYENANIYVSIIKISGGFQFVVSSHSSKIQDPQQIFQEYYREEKSKDGFGLGLNLVKRICEEENIILSEDLVNNLKEEKITPKMMVFKPRAEW